VCAHTLRCGVELQGKTDQRFVEHAFRLMRDHLGVRSALTPAHFFAQVGGRLDRVARARVTFAVSGLK